MTDGSGRFSFALDSAVESGALFLAGARYRDVLYWGAPIHGTNQDADQRYSVVVFDTTVVGGRDSSLGTTIRHVVITPSVAGLQVEEIIDVGGLSDRTIVAADDSVPVWATSLSRDAHGVVVSPGGVPPEDVVIGEGEVSFRGALPPSGVRIVLQYVIPSAEYLLRLVHPTRRFELLVMPRPGMDLRVEGLDEAPVSQEMRIPLSRFTGADLTAGSTVFVHAGIRQRGGGQAWIWLLVSLALGAAALLATRFNAHRA